MEINDEVNALSSEEGVPLYGGLIVTLLDLLVICIFTGFLKGHQTIVVSYVCF